ncbi:MAG: OsmC family protein [Spongiibacteraceae bacterium]|nr:OsmC family protein [Spongiibacteraceae bacterium]
MSTYSASITWKRKADERYVDNKYSRAHQWHFDGGAVVEASSSASVVPLPYSVEANVDPEEALVAALSSCHMLFFLSFAANKKWIVDEYTEDAIGLMEKGADGKTSITKVTLRPEVIFSGEVQPSFEQLEKVHHQAHEQCFIANSVKAEVCVEIRGVSGVQV